MTERARYPRPAAAAAIALLSLSLLAPIPAEAGKKDRGPTRTPEQWAEIFNDPERRVWQKPVAVMNLLAIGEGHRVADLGAGTGYFTEYLSLQVGDGGFVTAVDIDPGMLEYIRNRDDMPHHRVGTVLADPDDPKLDPSSQDVVLVVDTWHHIKKRSRYIDKLADVLRTGGRVAIIDYRVDAEPPHGPPASKRLSRDKVVSEFERADWELVAESVALPYQYFLVFSPTRAYSPGIVADDGLE